MLQNLPVEFMMSVSALSASEPIDSVHETQQEHYLIEGYLNLKIFNDIHDIKI
jgi:hypothetical protein